MGFPGLAVPQSALASQSVGGDPNGLAAFSGRGPADRRIKPEVVAPGTAIISARSAARSQPASSVLPGAPPYRYDSGTSMAAPAVSGVCALIRQWYVRQDVRAIGRAGQGHLVNGTRWLTRSDAQHGQQEPRNDDKGSPRPTYRHPPGTGRRRLGPALRRHLEDPGPPLQPRRHLRDLEGEGTAGHPARICLTYTDPPGRVVQNDVNMFVQAPGSASKLLAKLRAATHRAGDGQGQRHRDRPDHRAGRGAVDDPAALRRPDTQDLMGQAYALVVTGALDGPLEFVLG